MVKREAQKVTNGDDLSGCCLKCGSDEVVQKQTLTLEWLPAWAKYLISVDFTRLIYNKFRQEGLLTIGFCAKHAQSENKKRVKAYSFLMAACVSLGIAMLGELPWLVLISVIFLFAFLWAIMEGTPLRVVKIDGEQIWLSPKVHVKKAGR